MPSLLPLFHKLARCLALTSATLPFLMATPAQAAKTARASLAAVKYGGMAAYRLSDGRSEAVVVPALGRVMRYGLVGGANWLWNSVPGSVKSGEWRNWGGDKSWPAPQSQWPLSIGKNWPPSPAWDGVPHRAEVLPGGRLRLTSGLWPRWNCRVIREYSFDESGAFQISQTFEKTSGPPVELGLWNITQIATPEAIFLPANPQSAYVNGFHWLTKPEKLPDISLVRPNLLRIRPSGAGTNKIGVDAPLSTVVVVKNGLAFRQSAARLAGSYPDGALESGFPLEVFDIGGGGAGHYMETELLSPLRLFYAGTRWTHSVKWSLHSLNQAKVESPQFEAAIESLIKG